MFVSHHTLKWTRTCRSHGRHPHAQGPLSLNRPHSLGPCDDGQGEARAVNRHWNLPFINGRTAADQPVFQQAGGDTRAGVSQSPAALGTQVAVCNGAASVNSSCKWLRKPTYWSEGSSGARRHYGVRVHTGASYSQRIGLVASGHAVSHVMQSCHQRHALPNRDIAHMNATSLGYLTYGRYERSNGL